MTAQYNTGGGMNRRSRLRSKYKGKAELGCEGDKLTASTVGAALGRTHAAWDDVSANSVHK